MGTKTKLFTSALAGAPVLSGQAGALIAVLDAVLVNGWGLQTVTSVVIAGGIATVTLSSPPAAAPGTVVLLAGATPSGLNGEQRVIGTTVYTVTFATALGNQTASGAITFKVAPAGWTKLYTGTNLAAYKSPSSSATGCVLKVDDTGTTIARVRGYEAMTDISTGTGPFPTVAQWAAPGLWWSKSNAASSAVRPWRIVADDRGFFYFPKIADTASEHHGNYFGDILSLKSNDPYACVLRANASDQSAVTTSVPGADVGQADSSQSYGGLYVARAANTLGGAVLCFNDPITSIGLALTHTSGSVGWPYPSPIDNGLLLTPVCIYNSFGYRGYYPGLRTSPQITNAAFSTGDVVAGSGDMVGKSVTIIKLGNVAAGGNQGVVFVDHISDWR